MYQVALGFIFIILVPQAVWAEGSVSPNDVSTNDVLLSGPTVKITAEDIDRYIRENLPEDATGRATVLNRDGIYREMAEALYVMRALSKEAESQPEFDEAQSRWAAEIAYQRRLVKSYRVAYVRDALKDVDWDSKAREAYNANPKAYKLAEKIEASHILIKTDERTEEEAYEQILDIHKQLLAGGDFAELAIAHSEDGAASAGGQLGKFGRGQMVPEFEKAAFELREIGDISAPVKTNFGYHIVKLTSRQPAGSIPFEKAKSQIISKQQTTVGNQVWQEKLIRLRNAPDVAFDEKVMKALKQEHSGVKN